MRLSFIVIFCVLIVAVLAARNRDQQNGRQLTVRQRSQRLREYRLLEREQVTPRPRQRNGRRNNNQRNTRRHRGGYRSARQEDARSLGQDQGQDGLAGGQQESGQPIRPNQKFPAFFPKIESGYGVIGGGFAQSSGKGTAYGAGFAQASGKNSFAGGFGAVISPHKLNRGQHDQQDDQNVPNTSTGGQDQSADSGFGNSNDNFGSESSFNNPNSVDNEADTVNEPNDTSSSEPKLERYRARRNRHWG